MSSQSRPVVLPVTEIFQHRPEHPQLDARRRVSRFLDEQNLAVALQPIVSLLDGRLIGAEALARFPDGRSPDMWFAEARETDQNLALDRLAFRTCLPLIDALPADSYLSINSSPELIMDPTLQSVLLADGVCLTRLVIEITEHVAIPSYRAVNAALAPFRERGVRLAVDDTGAGYASMDHVRQLRPDIVKIDRSLITGLTHDPTRRSLVTALIKLSQDIAATVIAEGVETPSELATVGELGVDHVQGYLLARPTTDPTIWPTWAGSHWLHREPDRTTSTADSTSPKHYRRIA